MGSGGRLGERQLCPLCNWKNISKRKGIAREIIKYVLRNSFQGLNENNNTVNCIFISRSSNLKFFRYFQLTADRVSTSALYRNEENRPASGPRAKRLKDKKSCFYSI